MAARQPCFLGTPPAARTLISADAEPFGWQLNCWKGTVPMKFLTDGEYSFRDGELSLYAKHDLRRYRVTIDREVFEQRYNATASGDFHEYWDLLLNNRAELEQLAAEKHAAIDASPGTQITIAPDDLQKS